MHRLVWILLVGQVLHGTDPLLRIAVPEPVLLDLRDADAAQLVPVDSRDPAQIEAARQAWLARITPLAGAASIRLKLPVGPTRLPLLLAANQALKAQSPARRLYLAFDPQAPEMMSEEAWGAVDGCALLPGDLGPDSGRWRDILAQAQAQFPGRTWHLWLPKDPGPLAGTLLGDGGRLVVPDGGAASRLAKVLPGELTDVEGGFGDLTLRGKAHAPKRWRFRVSGWEEVPLPQVKNEVDVAAQAPYDTGGLLALMRANQLRDRAVQQNFQAEVDLLIRFQGERGGAELGFTFTAFEKAGEPEELLRQSVRFNGVSAKLHGDVQLPVVEARTAVAAPVALTLSSSYRYRDGGPAGTGQRFVDFEPVDPDPTLYRGRLKVEESTGRILEERSSRSDLPGIVRSEDRVLTYGEAAPGMWRVIRTDSSERWMGSGGVGLVARQLTYTQARFNSDDFDAARESARQSRGAILKQTPDGYRYFVRQSDGTRRLEDKVRSRGRAVGGVVLVDPNAQIPVLPLAGLLLFDFNALDKGIQYGLLTAGVFNHLNVMVPNSLGRWDLKAETTVNLLRMTERPVKDGKLLDREGVDRRAQQISVGMGRDLRAGFRLDLEGRFGLDQYLETKEDAYRTPGYRLPPSGWTRWVGAEVTWLRKGFQLRSSYARGRRPSGAYGLDAAPQQIPDQGSMAKWGGSLAYDFKVAPGSWVHGAIGHMEGRGFDRFASLEFAGMVSGIAAHAVVADRLTYALANVSIPTGPRLRLEVGLNHGRARHLEDGVTYRFTGLRVSGDLPGFGWFTTVRLNLGAGLASDIQGAKVVNGMVSFLRIF